MSAADTRAAFPEPFRILGLRLLPLSLGRYRILQHFDCAYVADEARDAGIPDLILGLLVCSLRCSEFWKFIESGTFEPECQKWGKRMATRAKSEDGFSLLEKFGLFKRYIIDGSRGPNYIVKQTSDMVPSGHWSDSVELVLRAELGWIKEEIDERPLTKALADYFKHMESQGLVTILTAEDLAAGEANARSLSAAFFKGVPDGAPA